MEIKTIEIICKPCYKCHFAEKTLRTALRQLERNYKVKYKYEIVKNTDIRCATKYSANVSKLPFIVIDGYLAFAGNIRDIKAVKLTLVNMMKF